MINLNKPKGYEMKYLMVVLVLFSSVVFGDEVSLGLWSHHFDRDVSAEKCVNEKHGLFGYTRNRMTVATYKNSHCKRSFLVGLNGGIYKDIGYSLSVVSGYPKSMHLIGEYVVIPMVHYTHIHDNIGIRYYYIPSVLVATGFVIRF